MAIVDQALVKIVADTAGYVAGVRSVAAETAEAKRITDEYKQSGAALGQMIGGLVTGLAALTLHTINQTAAMNDLSQRTGLSTEILSSFGRIAELNGVKTEEFAVSATFLARAVAANAPEFEKMKIKLKDAQGNMRDINDIFEDVTVKVAGYGDGLEKTALLTKLFGDAGTKMTAALNQAGKQGFAAMRKEAQALGVEISGDTARAADDLADKIADLQNLSKGFANSLVSDLLPNLSALAEEMGNASEQGAGMREMAGTVATAIRYVGDAIIVVVAGVKMLVNAGAFVVDVIMGVIDVIRSLASAVAYDVEAIYLALKFDFSGAKARLEEGGREMSEAWNGALGSIKNGWEAAKGGINDAGNSMMAQLAALNEDLRDTRTEAERVHDALVKMYSAQGITLLPTETVYAPQTRAPVVDTAGAAKAKALQDQLDAITATIDKNATKLKDMAIDFVVALTPMDQVEKDYAKSVRTVTEAVAAQNDEIEKGRALGESRADTERRYFEAQELGYLAIVAATEAKKTNAAAAKLLEDVTGRYIKDLKTEASLIVKTAREQRVEEVVLRAVAEAKKLHVKLDKELIRTQAELNEHLAKVADIMAEVNTKSPFEKVKDDIAELRAEIERLDGPMATAFDKKRIEELGAAVTKLRAGALEQFAGATAATLQSIQSLTKEGSRSYEALGLAIQATTILEGIAAIVHQGTTGDPYTAIARMAAMAAAIASLGVNIRSFASSGFSDTAAQRQATQGTGSVLGDAEAKSESIAKAVEITAEATSELVGINRGMLNALLALQAGIGSAANMLARGAGDAEFGNLAVAQAYPLGAPGSIVDPLGFLGGSSKVTDEGIIIFGGALTDMLNSIAVGAYQEVQSRSWAFGSTHTNEGISAVSDEFATQFQLIIGSIIDTVRAGALALGILPADFEAALASYQLEEIRISLQDMSAEEQQAALSAVFSSIFDGIAGDLVPFIEQFQQVGEGLGETLVRVATGVQVVREAMHQLGLAIETTDPETFALISEGLISASGGLQNFISGMQSFVANFAPDAHQFEVAQAALTSALEQVGLAVPATRDEMWSLMQTLDATTLAGQEQIATLLRLAGVADSYYNATEAAAEQLKKAIADLISSGQALSASLWGTPLSRLEDQIAEMQSSLGSFDSAIDYSAFGVESAVDRMRSAISLLLGDLSPLNDQQKLQAAMEGLMAGTVSQEEVLEIGRRLYASSEAYNALFSQVQQYAGYTGGSTQSYSGGGSQSSGGGSEAALAALIAERDAILEQQRVDQGRELADIIAQYSDLQGVNFEDAAAAMNTELADLGELLGLNADELTSYLENLTGANDRIPDAITSNTDRIVSAILSTISDRERNQRLEDSGQDSSAPSADGSLVATSVDRTTRAVDRLSDTILGQQGRGNYQ